MWCVWCCWDLALIEPGVTQLHGVDTQLPLGRPLPVKHFDAVTRSVHEVVHSQQTGITVSNPRYLKVVRQQSARTISSLFDWHCLLFHLPLIEHLFTISGQVRIPVDIWNYFKLQKTNWKKGKSKRVIHIDLQHVFLLQWELGPVYIVLTQDWVGEKGQKLVAHKVQWCMTLTDMRLTEYMGLTEKIAATDHFM